MGKKTRLCAACHGEGLAPASGTQVKHPRALGNLEPRNRRLARGILQFNKPVAVGPALSHTPRALRDLERGLDQRRGDGLNPVFLQCYGGFLRCCLAQIDPQENRCPMAHGSQIGFKTLPERVTQPG